MKSKLLIVSITLLICGCAEKVRINFTSHDIAKAVIRPADCAQTHDGYLICKNVRVRLNRIEAK